MAIRRIIPILGDQLTRDLASLRGARKAEDRILMAEVMDEATYVRHHKKKIAFCFAAMRAFAAELQGVGWHVDYVRLDDEGNTGSITGEVAPVLPSNVAIPAAAAPAQALSAICPVAQKTHPIAQPAWVLMHNVTRLS